MRNLILTLLLLLLPVSVSAQDKAMERIVKNGEINCGVYALGSIFSYDTSGKPKGFTVDLMNEISMRTGLKVKYTEISSFATLGLDMNSAKFDMICAPVLFFPPTSMKFLPSLYLGKDEINIYADASLDITKIKTVEDLNDPKHIFVGMDGELGGLYAPKMFPKAKLSMLPLGTPPAQMFMDLQTKKAHFMMLTRLAANAFLRENPGKLKMVLETAIVKPSVRLFYPVDSNALKANMDAILEEMQHDGTLDKLLKKHDLVF
ncbi:MAG TPA: hypothetical protein DCY07_06640 [Rhodospirillaceae bacterium]|nr:hypothetical protein [Rhodospirillaceae bacterium]